MVECFLSEYESPGSSLGLGKDDSLFKAYKCVAHGEQVELTKLLLLF